MYRGQSPRQILKMTTKKLLSSSEDEHIEPSNTTPPKKLTINKDYAVQYEEKKRKQELAALQEKYKNAVDSCSESDSESDEEEDETGELLTKEVDAKILTTLATIKARAPEIYKGEVNFFDAPITSTTEKKEKEESKKKLTLKEYQSKRILEGDSESDNDTNDIKSFANEQSAIKDELKRAFYSENVEEEDDEMVMTKKSKTKEELEREELEYREFLLQNLKSNANAQQAMQDWIAYSSGNTTGDVAMSADDKFLIDYIMNRGWMERNNNSTSTVTVDAIIKQVEESEEEVEKAEEFEEQYNFRYEHQDAANIITHPRHIEESMRRQESKRQRERESAKLRKQEEKIRQQEEIKRLKNLKRQELMQKAEKLIKVSGTKKAKVLCESSDSEFDPDAHDQKMAAIFDDDYYQESDDQKNISSDDDNEYREEEEISKPVKKLLKKTTKIAVPEKVKQAIEEHLYKLDYEDKIDDIQCRFKYKSVPSSTYGLQYDDIFSASDKALNRHVSLKKLAPYRPEEQQLSDMQKYGDKRRVWMFRNAAQLGKEDQRK